MVQIDKNPAELMVLKQNTPGISMAKLTERSRVAPLPGECPFKIVDYRESPNPYLARYGEENWRGEIKRSVFMQKYMCITDLVQHIHNKVHRHSEEPGMKIPGFSTMMHYL